MPYGASVHLDSLLSSFIPHYTVINVVSFMTCNR